MTAKQMTLEEVRARGQAALLRELGPAGYLRFLQEYLGGHGDYTKERRRWVKKVDLSDLDRRFGRKRRPPARKRAAKG